MKKFVCFILAIILVLGLVGCSSTPTEEISATESTELTESIEPTETIETDTSLSYEEMLEQAEKIELQTIYADAKENVLRAEQEYVGKVCRVSAFVSDITKENFSTPQFIDYGYKSIVNLVNKEDLISLSESNTYEIIGVISSVDDYSIVFSNAYVIDADDYDFVLDGLYYSATGSIDPSKYNISVEEYFERNPQKMEENLSDDDEIDLFVFATLNSLNKEGADLYLPNESTNGELQLELSIGNNSYNTAFKMNDFENRMSKFFDDYDDGYSVTDTVLKAGSGDSAKIVGLFFVEYGVYKEAKENNTEITINWGGRYTITLNAQDIVKIDSVSAIAEIINE